MKKITLAIISILTAFQIGCASPQQDQSTPAASASDNRGRLITFGDSITACLLCYPALISAATDMKLMNQAVGGTSIEQDEQIGRILRTNPQPGDKVIFLTGFNNMRGQGLAGLSAYRQTLRTALQHFAQWPVPTYIGTAMNPLCDAQDAIDRNGFGCDPAVVSAYVQAIKDEVQAVGASHIQVVDINAQWVVQRSKTYDLVHLTPAGNAEMARLFLEVMQ